MDCQNQYAVNLKFVKAVWRTLIIDLSIYRKKVINSLAKLNQT